MKLGLKILAACIVGWLLWVTWLGIASDFNDSVIVGTYHLVGNRETSTLVLRRDHTFEQEVSHGGIVQGVRGSWRSISALGGVVFSKEFLPIAGEEPGGNGLTYADVRKVLGIYPVRLLLRTYDVEWYGRLDPNSGDPIAGTYAGDEEGVQSSLVLRSNHTFEQAVSLQGLTKHASGMWKVNSNGDIDFSRAFIKSTGDALNADETATAWNPKGGPLQIEIDAGSKPEAPVYWKWRMPW